MRSLGIKTTMRKATKRVRELWCYGTSMVVPYNPMNGSKEALETEYLSGTWDYLRQINELSRFSVIVGYCHHLKPAGKILEVGCGEGLLKDRLCPLKYSRYVGIDISAEAIDRAARNQDKKSVFVREDARIYHPNERFDLIIFNECLEYFEQPLSLVQRYEPFLEKDGVYIVSMFVGTGTARTKYIWRMLKSVYLVNAETQVSTRPGYTWNIKILVSSSRTTIA